MTHLNFNNGYGHFDTIFIYAGNGLNCAWVYDL